MKNRVLITLAAVGIMLVALLLTLPSNASFVASENPSVISPSVNEIKEYIISKSKEFGIDVPMALFIAEKESQFNPSAVGDQDKICLLKKSINYGEKTTSRGLWEISDCAWPEVTNECAYNIECSTNWAMAHLKINPNWWSTWKFRKIWYKDYPY